MYWEVDFEKIPLAVESGRPGEGIHPPRPWRGPPGPAHVAVDMERSRWIPEIFRR